ncbi:MAG: ATP-binding protein [Bacteroidia bacterium]|nr:ATP-binding protein [Bacteroidia bacterium]MCX7651608.1 ATP-binding protein [Bacteroidia bacterium]MDW8417307.1 ATP-binding protein [Bacteroidia bacterium]
MAGWDNAPLLARIAAGEGLHLDFKQRIESARKIARTLSAFANTQGGALLIGVKDNGKICGADPEQEFYMVELAATRYIEPSVEFSTTIHAWEDKQVLEVQVEARPAQRPFYVVEEDGARRAYVRVGDKSRVAGGLLEALWRAEKEPQHIFYRRAEKQLLDYLRSHPFIDEMTLKHLLGAREGWKARKILVKYTIIGVLEMEIQPEREIFRLSKEIPEKRSPIVYNS